MASSNFNLRDIPADVMIVLKKEAKRLQTSVNSLILKLLQKGLGVSGEIVKPVYHDLDHLAGSWSTQDCKQFEEKTKAFERIEKELWQ